MQTTRFIPLEPDNLLYTYLSKRKVDGYDEAVNQHSTRSVHPTLRFLASKVNRLSNPAHPQFEEYVQSCESVLGFVVSTFASEYGHKAGRLISEYQNVALDRLGEGVASLVGLIVDLCVAKGRVFVIEEPENNLHPKALIKLLEIVERKSAMNQFLISTHSNIVVRRLAALPQTSLFEISYDPAAPNSQSTIELIQARRTHSSAP